MWEQAQVAWALGETIPEFEERPLDEQGWAVATWRTMQKIEQIRALQVHKALKR